MMDLTAGWFARMVSDGDLARMYLGQYKTTEAFCGFFQQPTTELYVNTDAEGIWLAAWLIPFTVGKVLGLWVRKDRRRQRESLGAVVEMYRHLLSAHPMLIGLTKQEALLAPHRKMGYEVLGPTEIDGGPAWFVVLTRERFEQRRRHRPDSNGDRQRRSPKLCPVDLETAAVV